MTDEVDDFLAHFGIKGMKWGIRKQDPSGAPKERKPLTKKQKLAIAGSAAAGITAIVAGGFLAAHYNVKLKDMQADKLLKAKAATDNILQRPTDLIYLSKPYKGSGTRTTLGFISDGKSKDYFKFFDKAGLNDTDFEPGDFRKMKNGDVAALFNDLMGRVDDATRPIPHAVFIPAEQAVGLNSVDDVIKKFGPRMEEMYQGFVAERLLKQPNI